MDHYEANGHAEETEIGLRDYLSIMYRRRKWFFGVYALVLLLSAAMTLTATPIYRAKTKLMVEASRFGSRGPQADVLGGITGLADMRSVETQIELIKSDAVIGPALERIGLDPKGPKPAVAVDTVRNTDVITISCRSTDPELAAKMANALADEYVHMTLERNRKTARQGRVFVEEQTDQVQAELKEAEDALAAFQTTSGISSVTETAASIVAQLQKQTEEANRAEAEVAAARAEVAALRSKVEQSTPMVLGSQTVTRNPITEALRQDLAALESNRASLSTEFTPTSTRIKDIDAKIKAIRAQMDQQAERVVATQSEENPIGATIARQYALAQARLVAEQERARALKSSLREAQARTDKLPADQRVVAELQRDIRALENRYIALVAKRQDLQLAEMVEIPSATVVEQAEVPTSRVYPNRKKNLALAIVFGFVLALGVVLVVNHLDDTFSSVQEIENRIGVPVLSMVYRQSSKVPTVLGSPMGRTPFAEAFRMIRSGLRFSAVSHPISTLVVTSAAMGEGKSTIAINTAIACAEGGQKVVLVDADLRRPSQHRLLDMDNVRGLTNCLVDNLSLDDALRPTEHPNLSFISSGPVPPNPGELLESSAMRLTIDSLRQRFDLVVLDAPPGTILADARVLAHIADAAILVVDIERTKRPALEHLAGILRREGHFIPGAVVNNAKHSPGSFYYGSHYGAEYFDREED